MIREVDAGPPCLCPVVPWDIEVQVRQLAPGGYDSTSSNRWGEYSQRRASRFRRRGELFSSAADANDSGGVDISDAVYLLAYLFRGGPAPYPEPGEDPTADSNACLLRNMVSAKDFLRNGDANGDGVLDLADCVYLLNYLRLTSPELPCEDPGDLNDDGRIDMDDALALCFPFGPLGPVDLGPIECGPDKTPDRLGCASSPCAR